MTYADISYFYCSELLPSIEATGVRYFLWLEVTVHQVAIQGSLLSVGVSEVLAWNSYIIGAQEVDGICAVCRLLEPLEQALPGRRRYVNGLKCLERRIHSTSRLKPYSKIKADTDFQTARALTRFMVMLPTAFHKTRWLKTHKKRGGQVIRASSSGHNTTAFFSACNSHAQIGYAFSVELQK